MKYLRKDEILDLSGFGAASNLQAGIPVMSWALKVPARSAVLTYSIQADISVHAGTPKFIFCNTSHEITRIWVTAGTP